MVSISTDGAANMVGKYSGMARIFNALVQGHCRENETMTNTIHSLWCFARLINLVTKTFLTMKPANVVLSFSDWFSNKWRQVSYRRFLTLHHQNATVPAIPQPSDTRWLFYRDVVKATIAQSNYVELFVASEIEFPMFWNGLKRTSRHYGPCVNHDFSFQDPLIKAIFDFTLLILDLLGNVNTIFQERFLHCCAVLGSR